MKQNSNCQRRDIILYCLEGLAGDKRAKLEQHIEACPQCQQYLAIASRFKKALKNLPEAEMESCPASDTLVRYCSGDLDDRTSAHVAAHMLSCDDCFDEMLMIQDMQDDFATAVEGEWPEPWPAVPQATKEVYEMAELADAMSSNGRELQDATCLLRIGQLAYRQLEFTPYASHWESLAKFAHGALNQAVIMLGERLDSAEYAQACYALSLVCRHIADWTGDVAIAEKSLSLLKLASHLSDHELAALKLGSLSLARAEAFVEELRERGRDATGGEMPGLVSAEAMVPVLNPVELLVWLNATYGVEPQRQRALWDRIRAILDRGLPVPEPFMRPRLMGAMGSGETPSDDEDEEELADLRPGILGRLYWPCRARELVRLDLNIVGRDRLGLVPDQPIQIALWANVLPPDLPEGLAWADWIADGRQYRADITAHQWRYQVPITEECGSISEEGRQAVRRWVSHSLAIELHGQEN